LAVAPERSDWKKGTGKKRTLPSYPKKVEKRRNKGGGTVVWGKNVSTRNICKMASPK